MSVKKKSAARGKRATVKVTAEKPLSATRKPHTVHVHPKKVEFFESGSDEPYSRIPNGAVGSDAAATVEVALNVLKLTHSITIKRFDAQGNPAVEDST